MSTENTPVTPAAPDLSSLGDAELTQKAIEVGIKEEARLKEVEAKEELSFDDTEQEEQAPEEEHDDDAPVPEAHDEEDEDEVLLKAPSKEESFLKNKKSAQREREAIAEERGKLSEMSKTVVEQMKEIARMRDIYKRIEEGDPEAALELGVGDLTNTWKALAGMQEAKKRKAGQQQVEMTDEQREQQELLQWAKEEKAKKDREVFVAKEREHEDKAIAIASSSKFRHIAENYDTSTKRGRADLLAQFKIEAYEVNQKTGLKPGDKGFFSAVSKSLDEKFAKEYATGSSDDEPVRAGHSPRVPGKKSGQLTPSKMVGRSSVAKPVSDMNEEELTDYAIRLARDEERRLKALERDQGED
jgi:hypothetical protein